MNTVLWCIAIGWLVISAAALVFNRGCAKCREHEEADIARDQAAQLPVKRAEDAEWAKFETAIDKYRRDFRETP